jgi:hypothetical protein
LSDSILPSIKRQVADEESVGGLAELVRVLLAAVLLTLTIGRTRIGKVDIESTSIEIRAILSLKRGGGLISIGELDVAETRIELAELTRGLKR